MYWSRQYLSIDPKKFATPTLTPITPKSVYRPHNHILRSRVGVAFQSRFAACISPFFFGPLAELRVSDSEGTRL